MEKFDLVVIGSGPGGYPAAIRGAQLGASVAIVEKEALGGTCLNWGCIPTKTLIASAELFHRMSQCAELGVTADAVAFDYEAMAKRKREIVAQLQGGVAQLLKANGVKVLTGTASFASRNRIEVKGKGKKTATIEAGATLIASGSVSAMPGFLPRSDRVLESRAFLDLEKLPSTLIVLGGGVIGCEFACMAAQLGVKVTVVEMLEDVLTVLDADIRRELRRHMEKGLGIRVLTGQPLKDIEVQGKAVSGTFGDKTLMADLLLVSVGRRPFTEGLGLENAGLETDETGAIPVDAYCRARAAGVYAIGDVTTGSTQLAHGATAQGIAAAENAVGHGRTEAETLMPACIFTSPEIGSVGLTEQQAKAQDRSIRTGKFMFAGLGKAMASGEKAGFVKWVADAETDRLLGAHAIGPHATDLIAEAALAVRMECTVEDLGRTVHCHPTFAESWMEAAHAVHGVCIHQAPRRR